MGSHSRAMDKKPKENSEIDYAFELKVTDSTEDSYVLEMKYGKFILVGEKKKKHAVFVKIALDQPKEAVIEY